MTPSGAEPAITVMITESHGRSSKKGQIKTVNGKKATINITQKGESIDKANVVKTDIEASNGVIHVIDQVILP